MGKTYPINVDYSKSLAEMIKAGKYDYYEHEINGKHFPRKFKGKSRLKAKLVQYDHCMSSKRIVADLAKRGLRAATVHELVAFGERYPNEQRKGSIVALGSVWRDWNRDRCVAHLYGNEFGRRLELSYCDGDWRARYRFLAFRK